ncbi:VWA domain-containing protein [Pseudomonas sp. LS1212]|uniref:VWA domain-containing protein n=1 Tax=Pseudomonas sp. LS1212 TaxID=2972478 RepID=UPI00215D5114|nr:VWA domain-containing protein [Pseudomonas sp. LS1212]UVJ46273.1 VWA domain-containing protein [Pseudomonas sp. LS1212]
MDIDLSALHFLRPLFLLLIPLGVLLPLWRRHQIRQRRLQGSIAAHLLKHLLITPTTRQRLQPVHLLSALLILGALAAAGPTWEQDRPPFLENQAVLLLALDLSPSMDASDVAPSRLEAAKHKMHDLIARQHGLRIGLLAYAGSAHLVLPPSDDLALLDSFLQALATPLIERPGKDALGVIEQARRLLAAEQVPGTVVLMTDGADASQFAALEKSLEGTPLQVLILAVGSSDGGVLRNADGQPRTDSDGRAQVGRFDQAGLQQLAKALDAPLGSLTLDDDDLDWIELHAQRHFQAASADARQIHWKDAGYWLTWPLAVLALLCIRRGWNLNWAGAVLLAVGCLLNPAPARAGALADAFMTADQQGRWAFDHHHYGKASTLFEDPYWQGLAAYRAADYDRALGSFARLDSPQAYFYQGNIHTRQFHFDQAIAAYEHALKLQPQFPEATANLALARALQKDYDDAAEKAPQTEPDQVKFDKPKDKGDSRQIETQQASSDELWLQNLTTSPATFLKQKFSLQDAEHQAPPAGARP